MAIATKLFILISLSAISKASWWRSKDHSTIWVWLKSENKCWNWKKILVEVVLSQTYKQMQ